MRRMSFSLALVLAVFITGCGTSTEPVENTQPSHSRPSNGLNKAVAFPFEVVFDDINPCTGLVHTVTITGTTFVIINNGSVTGRQERTITTSSGFVGHGTASFVDNGQNFMFRLTDILTNTSGDRIRASGVLVIDLSTGATRVFEPHLECLGS